MKKLFYFIIVLMLIPALVACGATAAAQPSEAPAQPTEAVAAPSGDVPPQQTEAPVLDGADDLAALNAVLDEIDDDAQPGSAGSSLKAAVIAANMLNWAEATQMSDDEVRQATLDWLSPKGNDVQSEFSMKLGSVYDAYKTLISADSEGLISDAGLDCEVGQWGYEPYSSIETVAETVGLPEY